LLLQLKQRVHATSKYLNIGGAAVLPFYNSLLFWVYAVISSGYQPPAGFVC
jgi:hypothetical protein